MTHLNIPLTERERLTSLDLARGVAILGIFLMNIRNFALPLRQFDNPAFPEPPARAADLWCWAAANFFFEDKMIAIFSILFGAGMAVMVSRLARPALIHYRRMAILLLIGLAHAYGLWYGDILNTYALCGLLLFPFLRLKPGIVIGVGCLIYIITIAIRVTPVAIATFSPPDAPGPQGLGDRIFARALSSEEAAYHGSWLDLARWRADLNTVWHYIGFVKFSFWRSAGLMLIGMGLARLDIFSPRRTPGVAWGLALGGYAVGATLVSVGMWLAAARTFGHPVDLSSSSRPTIGLITWSCRFLGAATMALGHIGAILLIARIRALRHVLAPLAAAGRMALSNYLLQSLIAVLIFDGWAGGQWGKWRFSELTALVVGVWIAQLILSPLWLRTFNYGPAEWLWRWATYGRRPRMRREPSAAAAAA